MKTSATLEGHVVYSLKKKQKKQVTEHLDKMMYVHMYTVQIQRYLINTTRSAALRAKRQQRFFVCFYLHYTIVFIFSATLFSSKRGKVLAFIKAAVSTNTNTRGESRVLKKYLFASYIYMYIYLIKYIFA